MSYMQIAVWFRRETCAYFFAMSFFDVFTNNLFDKIFGYNLFFFCDFFFFHSIPSFSGKLNA